MKVAPLRSKQLGGWDIARKVKDPRRLFQVTIPTSIDIWDEFVLARDRAELDRWIAQEHPEGFCKGYEPVVKGLAGGLDTIHMVL